MIPKHVMLPPEDKKEGNYWELPNGEKQNRCPRTYINEEPENWSYIVSAYNAYDKGFLPSPGGMDAQPSLFMPTMTIIHSALQEENEYERQQAEKMRELADRTNAKSKAKNFAKLPVPGKR